jgi:hypothetical protein
MWKKDGFEFLYFAVKTVGQKLTIVPMKFQLLHRAVKGTPVVSLNIVTRVVHIRLLAR